MMPFSWVSIRVSAVVCGCVAGMATIAGLGAFPALALPPADEIPEEVLRNHVELGGRSPLDNSEVSATEYAELEALLQESQETNSRVSPELQRLIVLLKLRKLLRSVTPF